MEKSSDTINNLPNRINVIDFIKGQSFIPSATEISSPFAKIILLILREFSEHRNSPKDFAQNIYQAKQLAMDINQKGLETFCDLMIAFAYSNIGFEQKAEIIYKNIEKESSKSSIYHERLIARYLLCRLKLNQNQSEELISEISNVLEELQNNNNQAKLFQLLFSKLLIDTEKIFKLNKVDIKKLEQNLSKISPDNSYAGIV